MANAFGTVRSAPIIVAALSLLAAERPLLQVVALDLGMKNPNAGDVKKGQTIMARINAVPTVSDYVKGAATNDANDTDIPLVLDGFKQTGRSFTADEINSIYTADGNADRDVISEMAGPMAQAIGDHFVDGIASLWTHANFPSVGLAAPGTAGGVGNRFVKAAAAMDYSALVDLWTIGQNQKWPKRKRFVTLNSNAFGSLIKDPTVTARYAQQTQDTIEASIGRIAGFDDVNNHAGLAGANATANLVGFAGCQDSVVFATRVPTNPSLIPGVAPTSAYSYQVIVEPKTGLQVLAIEWIDELQYNLKLVWLQGWAKGVSNNGILITSA